QMLHPFEQRTDAAPALVGHRAMPLDREGELLVLGADAEFRLRLDARLEPRDEFVARFDRRHVDLVTSHTDVPAKRAATLSMAPDKEQWHPRHTISPFARRAAPCGLPFTQSPGRRRVRATPGRGGPKVLERAVRRIGRSFFIFL